MSSGPGVPLPAATGTSSSAAGTSSPASPSGTQTSAPAGGTPPQPSAGIQTASLPASLQFISGDPLFTVQQVIDHSWPDSFVLDRDQANWNEWSLRLNLVCRQFCLSDWLDPSFVPPDVSVDPRGHRVYSLNDQSLMAFMLRRISQLDYKDVHLLPTSRAVYAELRQRYEQLGSHAQILLIDKVMKTEFCPGVRIAQIWNEADTLIEKLKAMGPWDWDKMKAAIAIKASGRHYEHLQSALHSITKQPNFSVKDITNRLLEEDEHIRNREAQGLMPVSTAFAAQTSTPAPRAAGNRTRPTCSHCKRTGHLADFCVQPGGKMAGRSLEEAMAAYRASKRQQRVDTPLLAPSANVAVSDGVPPTSANTTVSPPFVFNGVQYALVPMSTASTTTSTLTDTTALSALAGGNVEPIDAEFSFHCGIAEVGDPHVSIDWDHHSDPIQLDDFVPASVALSASQTPGLTNASFDSPFFVDTGANTHLSPVLSDFKTLRPISPHPISGVGGAIIHAVGIGSIDIPVSASHKFTIHNALYAPASKVRLISVLTLNRSGGNISHFGEDSFWVTNRSGETILRGSVNETRKLYCLDPFTAHKTASPTVNGVLPVSKRAVSSAFYASRMPDVETWHRRLGHCSFSTVVDMARKQAVEGMTINLSSSPPKCEACVLGKQTRSTVPKSREGERASRPLERVFVDLCGPIRPASSSGRLYSMNVIDDFSSYVWSLPLRSKGDAAPILQMWHRAVTNGSNHRLQILVTDNGELVSNSMRDWCAQHGIDHRRTAPYTSAQNGRAERLHRTLLEKARAMLISCKAPPEFWDEFCATSAYLTNLTATSSLQGRTPFELWFDRKPSLSHLREIGCRAFALIPTAIPKSFARSRPCVLVGYSPHSKAYRLWDPASGQIFTSFHVSFLEHLDEVPTDLLPGTTVDLAPHAPPSWDTASKPQGPTQPPSISPSHIPPVTPIPSSFPFPPHLLFPPNPPVPSIDISPVTLSQNNDPPPNQNNTVTDHTVPPNHNTVSNQNNTVPPEEQHFPTSPNSANPPTIPSSLLPTVPTLRRSNRTRFSSARDVTNDGLLPDSRLSSAISDSKASSARTRASRLNLPSVPEAHVSTFLDDLPPDDFTHAFLSEFSDLRETHDLLFLDLPSDCDIPLQAFLSDIETGSLEPACHADTDDDPSWREALASPEREYWIAGAREELRSLRDLQVFVLVPRSEIPRGKRVLKGKLVCKRKRDDTGKITRYKVRYVAKGYAQQPGIDFTKTTAPTVRLESLRSILHLAASLRWDIQHFDIKTAFLHGVLAEDETAYMEQPPGFEAPGKEEWVMRLMKSIYGMRQAGRRWNQTFHKAVSELGFARVPCDWCVYIRRTPNGTVIFAVHVDDIFSIADPPEENARFRDQLKSL